MPGVTVSCAISCRSRAAIAASPFRRHVHALARTNANTRGVTGVKAPIIPWSVLDLMMLQQLPQLRRIHGLRVELATDSDADDLAFTFPPLLESADLHLSFDYQLAEDDDDFDEFDDDLAQTHLLRALWPCRSLTQLSITLRPECRLSIEALLDLPTLQILAFDIESASDENDEQVCFDEEQMSVVKQLPNLRRLTLRDSRRDLQLGDLFMNGWPRWLCSLPHRLQQLQELDLSRLSLRPEHVELLHIGLPALTALEPDSIHHPALILLPKFASRLRTLNLRVDIGFAAVVGASLFLPHLTPCSRLTELTLCDCAFSEAEAETLCRALPDLKVLELQTVGWPSFEPLRHLPQLESFSLQRATGADFPLHMVAEHFAPLKRLRALSLIAMNGDPDSPAIAALRPPSALLPALVHFRFTSL